MASFQEAIGKTLLFEGGYSNNPNDAGGETYRGISRVNWPKWAGWPIIDRWKTAIYSYDVRFPAVLDTDQQLQGLVVDFYQQNFWQYDGLDDQQVADKVFDLSVNIGKVHAVKILQQAAGVKDDGLYGPNTERVVNLHPQGSLETAIRIAAENYHKEIVQLHPQDAQFLGGWLKRDDS